MYRFALFTLLLALTFSGCETTGNAVSPGARKALEDGIRNEQPGNYYVGRRYFKQDYKFWGYVRSPGAPWSTAKLVMLNENQVTAPDRAAWALGSDHNSEYRMEGRFSGDTVYEPASNAFYPEFVVTGWQLISKTPGPIFRTSGGQNPEIRVVEKPF